MFEGDPHENLKRDLRRLADDVAQLRATFMSGKRESLERWRDSAKDQFDAAHQQAMDKAQEVDAYVKENPWLTAGVAVAAGVVLGALLGKGKRR